MNSIFEPWVKYPPLQQDRLSTVACMIRDARRETVALHDPVSGDNEWSLGCRVYVRTIHALKQGTEKFEWLSVLPEDEKPLRFTFAIGSVPFRFYRGEAGDPPDHYTSVTYAELYQQQLAFQIDGIRLVDQILRLAVEIDKDRQVSDITLVEMDKQGAVTEAYRIPFEIKGGNVLPLQPKPINVAPPQVEALKKPGEKKLKDGHAGSK